MGIFDRFRKKPSSPPATRAQGPRDPADADLLKRLGNIAVANALVRGGQDPERLMLAINLDGEGKVEGNRPTMKFQIVAHRADADAWCVDARIDDAVASCRFTLALQVPELPLLDPSTLEMNDAPSLRMTLSKPADVERNPLARMAFLQSWRVDGGMEAADRSEPLALDVTVMGVELTRLDYAYVPTIAPNEHWVLLKCYRGEQSIWLGLDLANGVGEIFPRRGEVESYQLALDALYTFA